MMQNVVAVHTYATLAMVGLIWFVQVVHYPMMADVGQVDFARYEQIHQSRTTWVVLPLMLAEIITAMWLWQFSPEPVPRWLILLGLILLGVIWGSTFFLQVPMHTRLSAGFDLASHRFLVTSNWIRTIAWSIRGVVAILIARHAFWMT